MDIDTDFEASKRNKVIANIKKYFQSIGGDLVPVCTFGTETSKSALQTACRGLGYEPELGSFFSSLVPIDRGFVRSLSQCYSGDEEKGYKAIPQFINEMDKYPDVWEVARKIEGLISRRGRHACLSGESKISTKNGYKNLKDVQIGDLVLTNDGTYQKVLDSFSSGIKDVFELRATNNFPILATSNHPFLIRSKISIDKIEGRKFGLTKPTWKTISEIVPVEDFIGQRVNTESIIPSLTYKMPYNEKDFWWIIGRYVGDGWTEERKHHEGKSIEKCCIICCNKKNQETYKVCSYLDKINFQYRVEEVKTTNKIYIKKEDLYDFLMKFKKYADCKIIPNFVQDLPIHLAESFLKGYFSADGYKRKETQTFKTVSYSLALGISELVKKVYRTPVSVSIIKPQIEIIEGRKVNSKQKYDCSFTINPKGTTRYVVDGNYIWSPVKSITAKNRIETFNLTVDVNNTYLANNIIVHNCGVLPVNQAFSDYNALMRAPDGGFTSQWELHDSEWMGLLKYDYLTTDFLDREHCCLDLLCDYGYCERGNTLRETYNRYLYPNKLDYKTKDMWELAINNKVASLFQFDTPVGLTTIKKVKPHSLGELAQSNSLMRLMPEGNKETPTEEYIKYKENIDIFNREVDRLRATDKEKNALKEILLPLYGVADGQEAVMSLLMHKDLFNFSIKEAHSARKLIAKKQIKKIEEYRKNLFKIAEEKGISYDTVSYIWNVQIGRQLGYSFS